jgi:hypothetical protein
MKVKKLKQILRYYPMHTALSSFSHLHNGWSVRISRHGVAQPKLDRIYGINLAHVTESAICQPQRRKSHAGVLIESTASWLD